MLPFGLRTDRAQSRVAIADFVGDIPLKPGHPSEASLAAVADRLGDLDVPVLLAWGSKDPVFNDDFAADLAARLPNTVLHRFGDANHLVMAETGDGDSGVAAITERFIEAVISSAPEPPTPSDRPTIHVCDKKLETRSSEILSQTRISGGCGPG